MCMDIRKARVQLQLNLARGVKNNKNLYRCVNQRRKVKAKKSNHYFEQELQVSNNRPGDG